MRKVVYLFILSLCIFACNKQESEITHLAFKRTDSDRWGLISTDGKILFENEFEEEPSFAVNGLFYVRNTEGLYEYYTAEKKPIKVGEEYVSACPFWNEITPVAKPEKPISFINKNGKEVFELTTYKGVAIKSASTFSDGLSRIKTESGLYGYVNTKGEMVIPPQYTVANQFADGLAAVWENDSIAYVINTKGEKTIDLNTAPSDYGSQAYFNMYSNGIMLCGYQGEMPYFTYSINKKGEKKEFPENIFTQDSNSRYGHLFFTQKNQNGKTFFGVMTNKGDIIIRAKYEAGREFGGTDFDCDNRMGFFGKDYICIFDKGKYGLINYKEDVLFKPKFDDLLPFYNNKQAFAKERNSYRLINKEGERVDKEEYDIVSSAQEGYNIAYSDYFDFSSITAHLDSMLTDEGTIYFNIGMTLRDVRGRLTDCNNPKKYRNEEELKVNISETNNIRLENNLRFDNDIVKTIYEESWWSRTPVDYKFNDDALLKIIEVKFNFGSISIRNLRERKNRAFEEYFKANFQEDENAYDDFSSYIKPNLNYKIMIPDYNRNRGYEYSLFIVSKDYK
ncbi:WG repeat-containing protein [Bacteroides sp. 224]|uniref:WG repeat-containing protein n=1 Tax=Bacteroides sp. 224 TaxID=2302936 RepID=UPI0013D0DAE7|nr:WG repeat-containing protein [Bacteroides sp. 224]NDV66335.1 WG repeat-containing protein [Bacteroides sp. 224]